MFKQPWQKRQNTVLHLSLVALCLGTLFWLQTTLPAWLKLPLIVLSIGAILALTRHLQEKYADTLVRVFRTEMDVAARRVQRVFTEHYVPFRKWTEKELVRFEVRGRGLWLIVESFPLNLPLDDHITPVAATRIALKHLSPENEDLSRDLCRWIDEAFVTA